MTTKTEKPITFSETASILGYSMIPVVIYAGAKLVLSMYVIFITIQYLLMHTYF